MYNSLKNDSFVNSSYTSDYDCSGVSVTQYRQDVDDILYQNPFHNTKEYSLVVNFRKVANQSLSTNHRTIQSSGEFDGSTTYFSTKMVLTGSPDDDLYYYNNRFTAARIS